MPDDPKEKLTRWLTEGIPEPEEAVHLDRGRLMFRGQKEWYHACLALDDEYFTRRVERDHMMMMSYKGRRSDDVVDSLTHLSEKTERPSGTQPIEDHLKARDKRKREE